jgi:hypothetical protein
MTGCFCPDVRLTLLTLATLPARYQGWRSQRASSGRFDGKRLTRLEVFRQSCNNPAAPGRINNGVARRDVKIGKKFMRTFLQWALGIWIAFLLLVVPVVRYRWVYTHHKRLREVTAGVFYRSGAMTAEGFADAVREYHIRTIVNLQDEYADPIVDAAYFTTRTINESDLCRQLGVRYVFLPPDLISHRFADRERPEAIDRFLNLLDDPDTYPVLIHCRAGLHRTGVMTAVYRMEYQGWSRERAIEEMKDNGFGEWPCTSANEYIAQYILSYQPRKKVVSNQ